MVVVVNVVDVNDDVDVDCVVPVESFLIKIDDG